MKVCYLGLSALALALFSVSCSDSPATPTSPSAGSGSLALTASQLSGAWMLTSMQVVGEATQPVPAGADYHLSFTEGRVSMRADCNSCGGAYSISGNTLMIGPNLACTRAACPTMQYEAMYTNVLSGEATAALSGSTLILTSSRGALHFTR